MLPSQRFLAVALLAASVACLAAWCMAGEPDPGSAATDAKPKFHIIGYLPDYRVAAFDLDVARRLTDLVYFSAQVDPAGGLKLGGSAAEHIQKLREIKAKDHVALSLCVGGWNRSTGFAELAVSPQARSNFAATLVKFCLDNKFDGVDLDWEHPTNESENRDYATLLAEVRNAFAPHRLKLTIALAGWQGLPPDAFQSVDRVHLMAYDAEGKHATYEFAEAEVARMMKRGVPAEKICLGLPFYGRGMKDRARELAYAQIVKQFQPRPDVDEVIEVDVYFNGMATIERKTEFALSKKLAGVMIWEIGQDINDERSLLRSVKRAVAAGKEKGSGPP